MELGALKKQIQSKQVQGVYVFVGEEWAVQKLYIQQMAKATKMPVAYMDTSILVLQRIAKGALVNTPKIYVVLEDSEYQTNEKLQESLNHSAGKNIVILSYVKADKRKKIFKDAVSFDRLEPNVLKKYIKKEVDLTDKEISELINICEGDYGRCLLECDKIRMYAEYSHVDHSQAYNKLVDEGTIHLPEVDATFQFVDCVLRRNKEAFSIVPKGNTLGVLQLLHNNVKAVLAIQLCRGKDVEKTSGIDSRQIYFARQKTGWYDNKKLQEILRTIQNVQQGIVTGKIDEQFALEYLMVNVL